MGDKKEQELADQKLGEKVGNLPADSSLAFVKLWAVAKSLLQENAKLTAQRDEWEATAVERQQLCDHWAERATEKDARIEELVIRIVIMDEALGIAGQMAMALKPLLPSPDSLTAEQKEHWQAVINAVFAAADHAGKYNLETWGGTRKAELHLVPKGGS